MDRKKRYGVMLDCSRNGVMRVDMVKKYAGILAKMGYNTLMLYTEDTYEIPEEPYFGHLRGRYSKAELKEIDRFCLSVGVELIPCIQTLSHLETIFRWPVYAGVRDRGALLLADEELTYALIEKMLKSLRECFTSDIVHIGMDEAGDLGLGTHLARFGYQEAGDIFIRHLKRVCKLAEKYGFRPLIWSDMLFKIIGKNYFFEDGEPLYTCPGTLKDELPENLGLAYWYYWIGRRESHEKMLAVHEELCRGKKENVWFAGGCWSWTGLVPKNRYSLKTMAVAMDACREKNVDNVVLTLWGDGGKEGSYFSMLPSLLWLIERAKGNFDEGAVRQKFREITGEDYDEFMALDLIGDGEYCGEENPLSYMLYDDPFMNIYAHTAPDRQDLSGYAKRLSDYAQTSGYRELFGAMAAYADLMSIKYGLGKKTRALYEARDSEGLNKLLAEYDLAIAKLEVFIDKYEALWRGENKAFGWEVQTIRLGGLLLRLKNCKGRLKKFLATGEKIEELEEEPLDIYGRGVDLSDKQCLAYWNHVVTKNNL